MAYIGNVPAEKYIDLIQQTFSSPTGTSFTLSQAVTNPVDIDLYIDNVKQDPTTYSASGTSLTTSTISSPSTMYCIYNGRAMQTVSVPDDSVGLGQMASATDGNLITFDASGNPAYVATGSDGQVLTSTGAGSAPAFEALPTGGWVLVSSSTASNDATIDFTGLESGYDYLLKGHNVTPATDAQYGDILVGASGPTYRTANYFGGTTAINVNTSAIATTGMTTDSIQITSAAAWGNVAGEFGHFEWIFFNPGAATATGHMGTHQHKDNGSVFFNENGGGYHTTAEAIVALRFKFQSGNVAVGKFSLFRRVTA
jgi:hypothetical protein